VLLRQQTLGPPFRTFIIPFTLRPYWVQADHNPSSFGFAVKHLYLSAIDAQLEDEGRNHVIGIIVVNYPHIHRDFAPLGNSFVQEYHCPNFFSRKNSPMPLKQTGMLCPRVDYLHKVGI